MFCLLARRGFRFIAPLIAFAAISCSAALLPAQTPAAPARPGANQERDRGNVQATIAAELAKGHKALVKSFKLNDYVRQLDGQWQGMRVASDGKVYFASSTHAHNHGAAFFRYDPANGQLKMLCEDITKVCGEDPTKTPPQGKIHSEIIEANGWLYFCTHLANYWQEAAAAYTGAHLVGLELASGQFKDFGVVHPNFSIYSGVGVDPKRQLAYAFVTPFSRNNRQNDGSHLHRINLATGENRDLGKLQNGGGHSFYFFVDQRGDCWLTLGNTNGELLRARPDSDKLDRYDNALPQRESYDPQSAFKPASNQGDRWWDWAQPIDGNRCAFLMTGDQNLYIFDSSKAPDWKQAFRFVQHIGPKAGMGCAVGGGRVFFVQRAGGKTGAKAADLHLMSASLDPKSGIPLKDHGFIIDQDGRTPWRVDSMAADDKGNVYMTGDWRMLPEEKGSLRRNDRRSTATEHFYDELWRGQVFSVINVSKDLNPQPQP